MSLLAPPVDVSVRDTAAPTRRPRPVRLSAPVARAVTIEHLVSLDIEAYSRRESVRQRARARATMGA
ncbi:hypothetical protein [Paraoerskovia marina]|uniref:Uncharacterized protein n=1 Tax=Paraoerskovia marina TaxID=545619 RepID=A0A1H1U4A4_9CELL|nr:hypothetical protein [Paraoerskovia marina]SDS67340.1 hypothetical protein SAMN04489860_2085 [Paraoerskovia marina]